jgi:hypothetical protein
MANKPKGGKPNSGKPRGVRGPGHMRSAPTRALETPGESGFRRRLNKVSLPFIFVLTRFPRWLLIISLGAILLLGLIQTGSWAWLGALLLGLLALFFAWLTALSWPRLGGSGKVLRSLIVLILAGFAVFKIMGRM